MRKVYQATDMNGHIYNKRVIAYVRFVDDKKGRPPFFETYDHTHRKIARHKGITPDELQLNILARSGFVSAPAIKFFFSYKNKNGFVGNLEYYKSVLESIADNIFI